MSIQGNTLRMIYVPFVAPTRRTKPNRRARPKNVALIERADPAPSGGLFLARAKLIAGTVSRTAELSQIDGG